MESNKTTLCASAWNVQGVRPPKIRPKCCGLGAKTTWMSIRRGEEQQSLGKGSILHFSFSWEAFPGSSRSLLCGCGSAGSNPALLCSFSSFFSSSSDFSLGKKAVPSSGVPGLVLPSPAQVSMGRFCVGAGPRWTPGSWKAPSKPALLGFLA